MMYTTHAIMAFALSSYATGWVLVIRRARKRGMVDLCQFIRAFIFAPFVAAAAMLLSVSVFRMGIAAARFPHWIEVAITFSVIVGTILAATLIGLFAIKPAIGKAYGVAKPFSEKICIVLYDKRAKGQGGRDGAR